MLAKEPIFDIFRGTPFNKDAVWVEAIEGLAAARNRMEEIAGKIPGSYFVFSVHSHNVLARIDTGEHAQGSIKPPKAAGAA